MLLQFYAAQEIPRFGTKLSLTFSRVLLTPDCIKLTDENKKLQHKCDFGCRECRNRIHFLHWEFCPLKQPQLKSGGRNPDGVKRRGTLVCFCFFFFFLLSVSFLPFACDALIPLVQLQCYPFPKELCQGTETLTTV